jgi:hypothetical protein
VSQTDRASDGDPAAALTATAAAICLTWRRSDTIVAQLRAIDTALARIRRVQAGFGEQSAQLIRLAATLAREYVDLE